MYVLSLFLSPFTSLLHPTPAPPSLPSPLLPTLSSLPLFPSPPSPQLPPLPSHLLPLLSSLPSLPSSSWTKLHMCSTRWCQDCIWTGSIGCSTSQRTMASCPAPPASLHWSSKTFSLGRRLTPLFREWSALHTTLT